MKLIFAGIILTILSGCGGKQDNDQVQQSSLASSDSVSSSSGPSLGYYHNAYLWERDGPAGVGINSERFVVSGGNYQTCCMGNYESDDTISLFSISPFQELQIIHSAKMIKPRSKHIVSGMPSGRVFIQGGVDSERGMPGRNGRNEVLSNIEIYDPVLNTITDVGLLPFTRFDNRNILDDSGNIVMLGGEYRN